LEPLAKVRSLREIDITPSQPQLTYPTFADHPQPLTIKVRSPAKFIGLQPHDLGPNVRLEWVF
jgi:hypothetical protein